MHNAQWLLGANWANGTNRANWGLSVLVAKDLMVNILLCCRKLVSLRRKGSVRVRTLGQCTYN